MGRKGVSKRKPKKSFSKENSNKGSSNTGPGESSSSVQALVNAKDAPLHRADTNPSKASNKKNQKGR
jgi:hypothetical protein